MPPADKMAVTGRPGSGDTAINSTQIRRPHGFYIRWLLISRCARMMKTRSFPEKNIGFDDSFDVIKCLQQIEKPDLLHVCAK